MYDVSYTLAGGEYDVEYNKIVYAYNGDVKVLSLPESRKVKYGLSSTTIAAESQELASLRTEIVLDKLDDLVRNNVVDWFKDINNNLAEHSDETIDYIVKLNIKEPGDIWPLDKMEPSEPILPSDGKLIHRDYGNVILDGDMYDVTYTSGSTP